MYKRRPLLNVEAIAHLHIVVYISTIVLFWEFSNLRNVTVSVGGVF